MNKQLLLWSLSIALLSFVTSNLKAQDNNLYVDGSCTTCTHDGKDWSSAYLTIQDALNNLSSSAYNIIHVAAGTYTPTDATSSFDISGVHLKGGYPQGGGTANPEIYKTILSGDILGDDAGGTSSIGDNCNNIVTIYFDFNYETILEGVTVEGGHADSGNANGGGVYTLVSDFTGPPVSMSPRFIDCTFQNNSANGNGGAVYSGIFFQDSNNPSFINCTFKNNSAGGFGGAIYVNGNTAVADVLITDSFFENNFSSTTGGVIYIFNKGTGVNSTTVVHNSIFKENSCNSSAGTFYTLCTGNATVDIKINNCVFYGNSAPSGPATYANSSDGGQVDLDISNSIYWNNLNTSSTKKNNFHKSGDSDLNWTVTNCLFNELTQTGTPDCEAVKPIEENGPITYSCTNSYFDLDPLFLDPTNNDFHLQLGSPAVNAGNNATYNSITGNPDISALDIDNEPRIQNGTVDLGVDESSFSLLPIELSSFMVSEEKGLVFLDWETATESENDFFTIERSVDGRFFEALGKVKGAGTSQTLNSYQFTDNTAFPGWNYYRLKQTDFDGTFSYSAIKSVELKSKGEAKIFPNPVTEKLFYVNPALTDGSFKYRIVNGMGQIVQEDYLNVNGQRAEISLNQETLTNKGIYILQVLESKSNLTFVVN